MTFNDPKIALTDEEAAAVKLAFPNSIDPALTVAVRAEMAAREYVRHALEAYRDREVARALR